jgi:hypothetical protein
MFLEKATVAGTLLRGGGALPMGGLVLSRSRGQNRGAGPTSPVDPSPNDSYSAGCRHQYGPEVPDVPPVAGEDFAVALRDGTLAEQNANPSG